MFGLNYVLYQGIIYVMQYCYMLTVYNANILPFNQENGYYTAPVTIYNVISALNNK